MFCVMVAVAMNYDFLTLTKEKIDTKVAEFRYLFGPVIDNVKPLKIPQSRVDYFIYNLMLNDKDDFYCKDTLLLHLSKCKGDLSYFRESVNRLMFSENAYVRHNAMIFLYRQDEKKSTKLFFSCLNDKSDLVASRALGSISYYGDRNDLFLLTVILSNMKDKDSKQAKDFRSNIKEMKERLDRIEKQSKK